MWRSIISSIGAALSAVGRGIDAALGAVTGAALSVATRFAPQPQPSPIPPEQWGGDPLAGTCPGGTNWRGPFPTRVDADEYRADIPVPTSIHRYSDGWWVSVDYESTLGERE